MKRMLTIFAFAAAVTGCTGSEPGADSGTGGADSGQLRDAGDVTPRSDGGQGPFARSDFSLPDVNPTSATYLQAVSPRDYLQKVSGWYFGHST